MSIRRSKEADKHMVSRPRAWNGSLQRMAGLLFSVMMSVPFAAHAGSGIGLFDRIFNSMGSSVNDVAVKVADLPEKASSFAVRGVAFSPDGSLLAVIADNDYVNVWDWRGKKIDAKLRMPGISGEVENGEFIAFSPDGKYLATCHLPGDHQIVIRVWDTRSWAVAKDIQEDGVGGCHAVGFTKDSKALIRVEDRLGRSGDKVIIYSTDSWNAVWSLQSDNFDGDTLAISPVGSLIAVGGTYWDRPSDISDAFQRAKATKDIPTIYIVDLSTHKTMLTLHPRAIGPMAWGPDGSRIAIANNGLQIFDSRSGSLLLDENLEKAGSMHVRITSNGRYIIESDYKGEAAVYPPLGVKIWNGQHSTLLQTIPGDMASLAVSEDSDYLAIGETGHVSVWKLK